MNDLDFILQHAWDINARQKHVPQRFSNMSIAVRDALAKVQPSHEHETAVANRDLLPAARERRYADINAEHDKMIHDAVDSFKTELNGEIVSARSRIKARDAGKVDPVLEVECRTALQAIDQLEAEQIFLEACRIGDDRTINAVVNAPFFAPVCRAEILVAGEKIRAHAQAPEVVSMLNALEQLLAETEQAERAVRRRCGLASDEMIVISSTVAA